MDDQEYRDHVVSSLAEQSATLKSVKEKLDTGLQWLANNDVRIEKDSRDRDEKVSEKVDGLNTKITYFAGAGTVVGAGAGFGLKYLLGKLGIHL